MGLNRDVQWNLVLECGFGQMGLGELSPHVSFWSHVVELSRWDIDGMTWHVYRWDIDGMIWLAIDR